MSTRCCFQVRRILGSRGAVPSGVARSTARCRRETNIYLHSRPRRGGGHPGTKETSRGPAAAFRKRTAQRGNDRRGPVLTRTCHPRRLLNKKTKSQGRAPGLNFPSTAFKSVYFAPVMYDYCEIMNKTQSLLDFMRMGPTRR